MTLSKENCGLIVVDVQEKLLPHMNRSCEVLQGIQKAIHGFQIMNIPIILTEQYPQGLGSIIPSLRACFREAPKIFQKTTFSCLQEPTIRAEITALQVKKWVLVGVEAHICILQTAKELIQLDYDVSVLNDAITSRSIYDYSTSIAEMRDSGVRITSLETVLFELVKDSRVPEFKQISELVQCCSV